MCEQACCQTCRLVHCTICDRFQHRHSVIHSLLLSLSFRLQLLLVSRCFLSTILLLLTRIIVINPRMLLLIPHLLEFQPSAILGFLLQSPLMHLLCFIKIHISLQLLLIRVLPLLVLSLRSYAPLTPSLGHRDYDPVVAASLADSTPFPSQYCHCSLLTDCCGIAVLAVVAM